ncbi:MAG: hypothetical protein ABSF26_03575 [Thermoguttaceae bacterium]
MRRWLSGSIAGNPEKRFARRSPSRVPGPTGRVRDRRLGFEPLEGRTLLSVSGTLFINGTAAKSDNIVLYNPPGSTHVDTSEMIFATFKIKGIESKGADVTLEPVYTGSGRVTISPDSFPDLPSGGCGCEVAITPTADSSSANDVHIILKVKGKQVAEDTMTVVNVDFKDKVCSPDTPQEMLDAGAYRIMPRKNTPVEVHITPDLANSQGQSITLRVTGQSKDNGTATVDGKPSYAITHGTDVFVELKGGGGSGQTKPAVALAYTSGSQGQISNVNQISTTHNSNANKLQLTLEVRGKPTKVQSSGFSVAAIPIRMSLGRTAPPPAGNVGFNVAMIVQSDSGNLADLAQVGVGELVQDITPTAEQGGYQFISKANSNGQYAGPASTHAFNDQHTTPLSSIKAAAGLPTFQSSGLLVTNQLYQFVDARTGVAGIPIDGSGFVITKQYTVTNSTVSGSIQKQPAAVSVGALSSSTGGGNTINAPFTNVPLSGTANGAQPAGVPADAVFSALGAPPAVALQSDALPAPSKASSAKQALAADAYFDLSAGDAEEPDLLTLPDLLTV